MNKKKNAAIIVMVGLGAGESGESGKSGKSGKSGERGREGGREREESPDSGSNGNSLINGDDLTVNSRIHRFMVIVAAGES